MTPFEYVLPMVSILVGLALGDLSVSLHRLLRARRRVRWDWLPLASAALVVLLILEFWWAFYGMGQAEIWTRYSAFLVLAAALITMFLLASAALPDEVADDGIDLAAYYDDNRRYFWALFAVFTTLAFVLDLLVYTNAPGIPTGPLRAIPTLVIVALLVSLAVVRSRAYHAVMVVLLLAASAGSGRSCDSGRRDGRVRADPGALPRLRGARGRGVSPLYEARVLPQVAARLRGAPSPDRFVLAVNGEPVARTGPHGQSIEWLG